jgi:hypothetical protein
VDAWRVMFFQDTLTRRVDLLYLFFEGREKAEGQKGIDRGRNVY